MFIIKKLAHSFILAGSTWGWKLREQDVVRPYVCEISKEEIYKIIDTARGYGQFTFTNLAIIRSLYPRGIKSTLCSPAHLGAGSGAIHPDQNIH